MTCREREFHQFWWCWCQLKKWFSKHVWKGELHKMTLFHEIGGLQTLFVNNSTYAQSFTRFHVSYSQRPHMTPPGQILGPEWLHISIWWSLQFSQWPISHPCVLGFFIVDTLPLVRCWTSRATRLQDFFQGCDDDCVVDILPWHTSWWPWNL